MDFISRLRTMKIQSATTIAIESLRHLEKFSGRKFDSECVKLLRARPTAVPLHNAIEQVRHGRKIRDVIADLKNSKIAAAGNASFLFRRKKTVMTHCHSSFVVASILENKSMVKNVIVTETRPKDQGIITAKDLLAKKMRVSFIVDSAISDFISGCDAVLVGADAMRKEGLVNKVGTHPIALVAKENKKPLYVVTSLFTLDKRKKIVIEQRPVSELHHSSLRGAKICNPAFDITPWKYVTSVVTERGVFKPQQIVRMIK